MYLFVQARVCRFQTPLRKTSICSNYRILFYQLFLLCEHVNINRTATIFLRNVKTRVLDFCRRWPHRPRCPQLLRWPAEQCSQTLSFIAVWIWLDFFRQLINGKTDRILSCWGSDLHCPPVLPGICPYMVCFIILWGSELKWSWGELQERSNVGQDHCVGEGDGGQGGGGGETVRIEGDGGGKWV